VKTVVGEMDSEDEAMDAEKRENQDRDEMK